MLRNQLYSQLILENGLSRYLAKLWVCTGIPGHSYLKRLLKFVASIGVYGALSGPSGALWAASRMRGSAPARASPSGIYPAGRLHWCFACRFDFGRGLGLPAVALLLLPMGLIMVPGGTMGLFLPWSNSFQAVRSLLGYV